MLLSISLLLIFFGLSNLFFIMFYSSFLRIKYILNDVINKLINIKIFIENEIIYFTFE